jgi:hypothetical protein
MIPPIVSSVDEFRTPPFQMPFPDAEQAVVAQEKVCNYLLNLSHPVGGSKAAWFNSLGYTPENWQLLADDLLRIAVECDDFVSKSCPYGVKYETRGQIAVLPNRLGKVVAVWIIEENSAPRLITAYPE